MGSKTETSAGTPVTPYSLVARSISSAATITTRTRDQPDPTANPAETTIDDYDINTSTIVRTAVASGVIVLILTALVLFFRVRPLSCTRRVLVKAFRLTMAGDVVDSISPATPTSVGSAPTFAK